MCFSPCPAVRHIRTLLRSQSATEPNPLWLLTAVAIPTFLPQRFVPDKEPAVQRLRRMTPRAFDSGVNAIQSIGCISGVIELQAFPTLGRVTARAERRAILLGELPYVRVVVAGHAIL